MWKIRLFAKELKALCHGVARLQTTYYFSRRPDIFQTFSRQTGS